MTSHAQVFYNALLSFVAGTFVTFVLTANVYAVQPEKMFNKPVVELFTSQGCSSCPPADKYLGELASRDDVIALTLPVDYWDYLGWKDTFASPQYSERQRAYARQRQDRQVYTPQIVINGASHYIGSRTDDIDAALNDVQLIVQKQFVPISLALEDRILKVNIDPAQNASQQTGKVWLVKVTSSESVDIVRGENARRTITYHNIARKLTPLEQWNGQALSLDVPENIYQDDNVSIDRLVVLLQMDDMGSILGASQITLPKSMGNIREY